MAAPSAFPVAAIAGSSISRAAIARFPPCSATIARARSIAHCAKSFRLSIVTVSVSMSFLSEILRTRPGKWRCALRCAFALAGPSIGETPALQGQ